MDVANPFNKWPKTLWCFCGSGKRFRKCHRGKFQSGVTAAQYNILKPDFDRSLEHVSKLYRQGRKYKLITPIFDRPIDDEPA